MTTKQIFKDSKIRVENFLEQILPKTSDKLSRAIRYSVFNGGKRLRPALTYIIGNVLEKTSKCTENSKSTENKEIINSSLNAAAASIELIHCYSLVHDDLPALDNDDLRRGKPTCHKKFDEATAILVGDALLTLAFEILSNDELNPVANKYKIQMINTLAKASGNSGMIKGQMQDMEAETKSISLDELKNLHALKTGKLFTTCIHLGILASQFDDIDINKLIINNLLKLGNIMGVLFQIQDDILDEISSTEIIGKKAGSDKSNNKTTYVSLLGIDAAKTKAYKLKEEADSLINELSNYENLTNIHMLQSIINFFIDRKF